MTVVPGPKTLLIRSAAAAAAGSAIVVRLNRRFFRPARPCSRISLATRLVLVTTPSRRSAAWTRSDP